MQFPNFTLLLYGVEVNTTQKISQSFSKLKYGPFGIQPQENFANILQIKGLLMKLSKTDEVWNSANSLFKSRLGLLSSRNFATMAT